jgi:hypothetical protein
MNGRFSTARILRGSAGVILLAAWALTTMAPPATAGASVTGSATVTYTANITVPAPPASNFSGATGGGDGWGLALTNNQLFNVFHHDTVLAVNCHNQSDASQCWTGPKTITDGSSNNFATSGEPGLWLDQGNGHLFVYATRASDSTAGVVCIDTTQPPSNTNPFCGYTPLTAAGDGPPIGGEGNVGDPASVNGKFYGFNYVNTAGTPTGTQNKLMCFDEVTLSSCAGQPYSVNMGDVSGGISSSASPSPAMGAVANQIIIPFTASTAKITCFNVTTGSTCAGSWPVAASGDGAPLPILNGANGTVTGFCLPSSTPPCFGLTGSSTGTPAGLAALTGGSTAYNGPPIILGARIYFPVWSAQVGCYDYAAMAACANFGTAGLKTFNNLGLLYTVNADPQRPTCIWVNSDDGTAQIQNFDAYTGGGCGAGAIRVVAASIVVPSEECIPANYTRLQILSPQRSAYSSAQIQFEDFNGNPLPGVAPEDVDATGSVNLAPLNLSTKSAFPQFLITINGGGTVNSVQVKLTWTGAFSPNCVAGNITTSGTQGYRLGSGDGGVFSFGNDSFQGSMASSHLAAPIVGIAGTPNQQGYWLAGRDGGVFAFGTAAFHGSAAGGTSAPIVGIAGAPDGSGYWLVGSDGSVYAFGSAKIHGSLAGHMLSAPIVGITSTPDGQGYWLVGADGGVFALGDATYEGSMAGHTLGGPIVGIAATNDGGGYWLAGADGGVDSFGDAQFHGSAVPSHPASPIVGILADTSSGGYWLAGADGGVFSYGDAAFLGCMANSKLNASEVGISS